MPKMVEFFSGLLSSVSGATWCANTIAPIIVHHGYEIISDTYGHDVPSAFFEDAMAILAGRMHVAQANPGHYRLSARHDEMLLRTVAATPLFSQMPAALRSGQVMNSGNLLWANLAAVQWLMDKIKATPHLLNDHILRELSNRYHGVMLTQRGYACYTPAKALELRTGSILIAATLFYLIRELARRDERIEAWLHTPNALNTLQKVITDAALMTGLLNDLGSYLCTAPTPEAEALVQKLTAHGSVRKGLRQALAGSKAGRRIETKQLISNFDADRMPGVNPALITNLLKDADYEDNLLMDLPDDPLMLFREFRQAFTMAMYRLGRQECNLPAEVYTLISNTVGFHVELYGVGDYYNSSD